MENNNFTPGKSNGLRVVSETDKMAAFEETCKFVTYYMKSHHLSPLWGPLSNHELGGPASKEIAKEAYVRMFEERASWKENSSFATQMIEKAKRIIRDIVEDYNKKKEMEVRFDELSIRQEKDMGLNNQTTTVFELRDFGYKLAKNAVKDNPKLLKYLDALHEFDSYDYIASKLGITKEEVKELEKELLIKLNN